MNAAPVHRRSVLTLLGSAAAAWPLAAGAQPRIPLIGYLSSEPPERYPDRLRAFQKGLTEQGYIEGRNVAIEHRWSPQDERMPELAADLVRHRVNVIAVFGGRTGAVAAQAATSSIPIVFRVAGDPVSMGIIASLARPGGNATGVSTLGIEVSGKRLELIHELLPNATNIAALVSGAGASSAPRRELEQAARTLGTQVEFLTADTDRELDVAFATMSRQRTSGLVIGVSPFFVSRTEQLAAMSARYGLPAVFLYREFAAAGGLMSYGGSITDANRLVGTYVGRILKGDKPADLPVQQATRVELILNMKTAKALGITFPITLLGRADEVIE